jgi:hypothetical protein
MSFADHVQAFNAKAAKQGWACTCDPNLTFEHKQLTAAAKLWCQKAAGGIPARTDLDARSLKPFLPHMTILEQVPSTKGFRYRPRLHGTALTRYAGDHTNRFLDDSLPAHTVKSYEALYDFALEEKQPLRVLWNYQVLQIAYLKGETFLAPLRAKEGAINLLLSVTFAAAKVSEHAS